MSFLQQLEEYYIRREELESPNQNTEENENHTTILDSILDTLVDACFQALPKKSKLDTIIVNHRKGIKALNNFLDASDQAEAHKYCPERSL